MAGHADTVGNVFVAGPINGQAFIELLLLEVIVDRIHIQTAAAHFAGSQIVEYSLSVGIKTLGILVVRGSGNGWPQHHHAASVEIGISKLDAAHSNIAGGAGGTGDQIHLSPLDAFNSVRTGLHDNRFVLQSRCFGQGFKIDGGHSLHLSVSDTLQRRVSVAESDSQRSQILNILLVLLRYDKAAGGIKILIIEFGLQVWIYPAHLVHGGIEGLEQRLVSLVQHKIVGSGGKARNGAEVVHDCHVNLQDSVSLARAHGVERLFSGRILDHLVGKMVQPRVLRQILHALGQFRGRCDSYPVPGSKILLGPPGGIFQNG